MKRRLLVQPLLLAAVFWWSGCGGCQSEQDTKAPAPAAEKQADKPAEQPKVEAAKPAAPAAPAAPAEGEGPNEPDCFVIVDAEPDFGPPPLKVQFMTEIDCTAEFHACRPREPRGRARTSGTCRARQRMPRAARRTFVSSGVLR